MARELRLSALIFLCRLRRLLRFIDLVNFKLQRINFGINATAVNGKKILNHQEISQIFINIVFMSKVA